MAKRHPRELEEELADQLDSVKAQAAVLAQAMQTSGGESSKQQQKMLKGLMAQAKDIEAKQADLREEIDKHYQRTIIEEERERLAPHPVDEPVRMEELRDANQEQLDSDTYEARKADAFKNRKRVVPSGGLAGFRVAPDLCGIDFNVK